MGTLSSFVPRLALVTALALLLAGCGSKPQVSTLQRYTRLTSSLASVTKHEHLIAVEVGRLGAVVSAGRTRQARKVARVLASQAHAQERLTGNDAARVRHLHSESSERHVKHYFMLVAASLSHDWWESHWLRKTASIIGRDPLLTTGNDASRVHAYDRRARLAAHRGLTNSVAARAYLRAHARYFRYHPVKPKQTA